METSNNMEQITVTYNPLRLIGDSFLHIQPKKEGLLSLRGVHQVAHEQYGVLGLAQVITVDMERLSELKTSTLILATGNVQLMRQLRDKGYKWLDEIGVYTLRFTSRKEAFSTLIINETSRAGIPLTLQTTLL